MKRNKKNLVFTVVLIVACVLIGFVALDLFLKHEEEKQKKADLEKQRATQKALQKELDSMKKAKNLNKYDRCKIQTGLNKLPDSENMTKKGLEVFRKYHLCLEESEEVKTKSRNNPSGKTNTIIESMWNSEELKPAVKAIKQTTAGKTPEQKMQVYRFLAGKGCEDKKHDRQGFDSCVQEVIQVYADRFGL